MSSGHYQAGDTRLLPWIHKTHGAVARMLDSSSSPTGFLGLRASPSPQRDGGTCARPRRDSRRQEFAADALAARIVGPGLRPVGTPRHSACLSSVYEEFLTKEFLPVMGAGFSSPFGGGFPPFLRTGGRNRGNFPRNRRSPANPRRPIPTTVIHPSGTLRRAGIHPPESATAEGPLPHRDPCWNISPRWNPELLPAAFVENGRGQPQPVSWNEVGIRVSPHWRRLVRGQSFHPFRN